MFCIADCFNSVLYAQFTNENRELKRRQFDKVVSFLDEQISNLQFKERHAYDISAIIGEEKKEDSYKRKNSYRVNNMQQAADYHFTDSDLAPKASSNKTRESGRKEAEVP